MTGSDGCAETEEVIHSICEWLACYSSPNVVRGRVRSRLMRGLHRQSFATIQLPSISGAINEGLKGKAGMVENWGGRGQVSEEPQNRNKEFVGSDPRGIQVERQKG